MVDVITEFAREGELSELLYADDLVLISETIEGHRDKLLKWKEAIESKDLKVNFGKNKVMVSSGITQNCLSKSKVDPCRICSLRVKANSVLCIQCLQGIPHAENVKGILERQLSRKRSHVMKWKQYANLHILVTE